MGWGILIIYAAGYLHCWRLAARYFIYDFGYNPEGEDIFFGIITGAFIAILWPLILPIYYTRKVIHAMGWNPNQLALKAVGEPPQQKLRRLEQEAEHRERRIQEMERNIRELDQQIRTP